MSRMGLVGRFSQLKYLPMLLSFKKQVSMPSSLLH